MSEVITAELLGRLVRARREAQGLSQKELGLVSNAGARFIGELEGGKATCQIGKALAVAASLGIVLVERPSCVSSSDEAYDLSDIER
jgi:ribosome-binding protein aMBF1 (putative translation factor)